MQFTNLQTLKSIRNTLGAFALSALSSLSIQAQTEEAAPETVSLTPLIVTGETYAFGAQKIILVTEDDLNGLQPIDLEDIFTQDPSVRVGGGIGAAESNYGMMAVSPPVVPAPPPDTPLIPYETAVAHIEKEFPNWQTISLEYPEAIESGALAPPLDFGVTIPDLMPSRAFAPVKADPYTGQVLQAVRFQDRSAALQTRVWIRFIHTGGAFGLTGKIIASIASAASLVLVYTGFALSWRRFFGSRKTRTP